MFPSTNRPGRRPSATRGKRRPVFVLRHHLLMLPPKHPQQTRWRRKKEESPKEPPLQGTPIDSPLEVNLYTQFDIQLHVYVVTRGGAINIPKYVYYVVEESFPSSSCSHYPKVEGASQEVRSQESRGYSSLTVCCSCGSPRCRWCCCCSTSK